MLEINDEFEKKLEQLFLFTDDAWSAGYILPSGKMTHYSWNNRKETAICHESIRFILGSNEQDSIMARQEFVGAGAIRTVKGHPGAEICRKPTEAQYARLAEYFMAYRDCQSFLDLQEGLGSLKDKMYRRAERAVFVSFPIGTNPAEILAEIRNFYG